ncbi:MAG: hypothetical protein Q3990_10100 [Desulfovibrionaceae bacterium]|nr:hypothetical protein [Desulfovibrionaceae bacterium]
MTAHDFVKNYYMHDSSIDNVEVLDNGRTIVLWVDFSYWMQEEYKDGDPENGTIKITFYDVSDYTIPENVNWDEIGVFSSYVSGETVIFNLENDMAYLRSGVVGDFLELSICSNRILVEAVDPT